MSKLLIKLLLLIAIIMIPLFLYARFIEPSRLTTADISLVKEGSGRSADAITVAVFADTHFSSIYSPNDFEKVIALINARSPDIILFCGDLIDDYSRYEGSTADISEALLRLDASIGKFAVFGNHDHGGGAHRAYHEIMENGGFRVLINESVRFDHIKLILTGIDDFILGNGSTEFVRHTADPDYFNFVFCHLPDVVDDLLEYNIDFMVAAHTHGGQINIPGYTHNFFPPYGRNYTKGIYHFDNDSKTGLYVNSGVATTILPLRFLAPPEITFFSLYIND